VFTAVASDSVGSAGGSSNLIVTVSPVTGLKVINFDALNTASGSVGGTNLSSYLAGYGVALSNVTVGTVMEAVSGGLVTGSRRGGGVVAAELFHAGGD
jgi:hypothetical protein